MPANVSVFLISFIYFCLAIDSCIICVYTHVHSHRHKHRHCRIRNACYAVNTPPLQPFNPLPPAPIRPAATIEIAFLYNFGVYYPIVMKCAGQIYSAFIFWICLHFVLIRFAWPSIFIPFEHIYYKFEPKGFNCKHVRERDL